jgi:stringent starvation protein B
MMNALDSTSTRPYLIRALYEWCTDHGLTPYIAVLADDTVQVPREHVRNGEIVLNISFDATSALKLGNEFVEFKARFGGVAREIIVPINRVLAIYARENGQGMAFPVAVPAAGDDNAGEVADQSADLAAASHGPVQLVPSVDSTTDVTPSTDPPSPKPKRPSLKVVK